MWEETGERGEIPRTHGENMQRTRRIISSWTTTVLTIGGTLLTIVIRPVSISLPVELNLNKQWQLTSFICRIYPAGNLPPDTTLVSPAVKSVVPSCGHTNRQSTTDILVPPPSRWRPGRPPTWPRLKEVVTVFSCFSQNGLWWRGRRRTEQIFKVRIWLPSSGHLMKCNVIK